MCELTGGFLSSRHFPDVAKSKFRMPEAEFENALFNPTYSTLELYGLPKTMITKCAYAGPKNSVSQH